MGDIVNVLRNAENVEISTQLNGYSGVRIYVGTDDQNNVVEYVAGDLNGQILEIKNPFGTQEQANNILADILGYQYQPLEAEGALLNPAAEIGDGVTVNGVYTGLFSRDTTFNKLMKAGIKAPLNQEIEHEFGVEEPTPRAYTRFVQQTKAQLRITNLAIEAEVEQRRSDSEEFRSQLSIQADKIAATVTRTGGNSASFGWELDADGHVWYAGNREVMRVDKNGLSVSGEVNAKTGTIGGFTIGTNAIYSNLSEYGGSQNSGVYIGPNGIQLGQNFRVDSSGNLYANNGSFSGNVYAGNIKYGGSYGTFSGAGITGGSITADRIWPSSLSTGQFVSGVNTSLGYANFSNGVFNHTEVAPYVEANGLYGGWVFVKGGNNYYDIKLHTHELTANNNGTVTIGAADITGASHSFNIADTKFYKDGVSAVKISSISGTTYSATADHSANVLDSNTSYSYGMLYGRLNASLSNGKSETIFVGMDATKAYNSGKASVPTVSKVTISASLNSSKNGYDITAKALDANGNVLASNTGYTGNAAYTQGVSAGEAKFSKVTVYKRGSQVTRYTSGGNKNVDLLGDYCNYAYYYNSTRKRTDCYYKGSNVTYYLRGEAGTYYTDGGSATYYTKNS